MAYLKEINFPRDQFLQDKFSLGFIFPDENFAIFCVDLFLRWFHFNNFLGLNFVVARYVMFMSSMIIARGGGTNFYKITKDVPNQYNSTLLVIQSVKK